MSVARGHLMLDHYQRNAACQGAVKSRSLLRSSHADVILTGPAVEGVRRMMVTPGESPGLLRQVHSVCDVHALRWLRRPTCSCTTQGARLGSIEVCNDPLCLLCAAVIDCDNLNSRLPTGDSSQQLASLFLSAGAVDFYCFLKLERVRFDLCSQSSQSLRVARVPGTRPA